MTQATLIRGGVTGASARFGLVLIHGRGARAEGMLDLGAALGGPFAMVAPQAEGASWWPTSFLAPQATMAPWVTAGLEAVDQAAQALQDEGVARDKIAVIGFSQGGCLALEYGARAGSGLALVAGLSAGLVGQGDTGTASDALYGFADKTFDYSVDLTGTQVLIGCHQSDPHIPLKRAKDSAAVFEQLGAQVDYQELPGAGHGIVETEIAALRKALQ